MLVSILKASNIVLFSVGFFFVIVDWRTKFDKSFLYFGLGTIAMSCFVANELWFMVDAIKQKDTSFLLKCIRINHVILMLGYFPTFFIYMGNLLKHSPKVTWFFIVISYALSPLLWVDNLLFIPFTEKTQIHVTTLYNIIFIPYFLIYMSNCLYLSGKGYVKATKERRKIFFYHMLGVFILFAFGIMDLFYFIDPSLDFIANFTSIGLIGFGALTTYSFLERFLTIVQEKEVLSQNLSQAYREATEGKSLQQIGESTAQINHELKNYLAIIQSCVPALDNEVTSRNKDQEKLKSIAHASERMNALCDGILEFAKQKPVIAQPAIDLNHSIQQCIEKNFPHYSHFFHIIAATDIYKIHIKPEKWEQVLINLLNNALEAGASHITLEANKLSHLVTLSIRDNGKGCDPEHLPKLFQAFFTTRKYSGGTGLGLSISKTIVENAGGWISVYNRKPRGMEFNIQFPISRENSFKLSSVSLWAQSTFILQEVQKRCELLQIPLNIHPLSAWKNKPSNIREQNKTLYLVEVLNSEDPSILPDSSIQVEHYLICHEGGVYVDGDPFSENFLVNAMSV